jgi:hypothetical protein
VRLFVFSCATTGRPEHGTRRATPSDSPFTQEFGDCGDYYQNLKKKDIRAVMNIDELYQEYEFSTELSSFDLYFWGVKKGHLEERKNYSFMSPSMLCFSVRFKKCHRKYEVKLSEMCTGV